VRWMYSDSSDTWDASHLDVQPECDALIEAIEAFIGQLGN
jgi:hypothetical protein